MATDGKFYKNTVNQNMKKKPAACGAKLFHVLPFPLPDPFISLHCRDAQYHFTKCQVTSLDYENRGRLGRVEGATEGVGIRQKEEFNEGGGISPFSPLPPPHPL